MRRRDGVLGEAAPAVMLTVKPVFLAKAHRREPSVVFFEIRCQISHFRASGGGLADGIYQRGVFARTDSQGGGEAVEFRAVCRKVICGFAEPQSETFRAARAAFGQGFQPCRTAEKSSADCSGTISFTSGKCTRSCFNVSRRLMNSSFGKILGL